MVDILHRVGAEAPLENVYQALATREGVAGWWATETDGRSAPGDTLTVTFREESGTTIGSFDLEVKDLDENRRVSWLVTGGPEEWVGTEIRFDLSEADGFTIVNFGHLGWREPVEFMHHCSTKWATFLLSLKALVEKGCGQPSPHDVKISNWH
ncbi:MAG TPA: SRPBCC domain-containing protein [Nocardioides sp.]|nr:SRPBCC domain-containing protein [Nocardioides sp.]